MATTWYFARWQTISETVGGRDHPHVLGLSGDLPAPRSFFTSNDLGKPILCTRTEDGAFRAFLNVCRHRGTIVEDEPRGEKKLFQCPFHAWTYDHSGALVGVPKEAHFGKVDRECSGLVSLPAVERYGLLWVSPDPEGAFDIDDLLGGLGPELEGWELARCEPHGRTTFEHAMNWKLAIDTFGETYHFNTLHRNTLATSFYGNVQMYDTYKRNHRMSLCLRTIDDLRQAAGCVGRTARRAPRLLPVPERAAHRGTGGPDPGSRVSGRPRPAPQPLTDRFLPRSPGRRASERGDGERGRSDRGAHDAHAEIRGGHPPRTTSSPPAVIAG
ncbi:MAG: aromatic ring-hydroxylating dioxygenase subunit alpha [Myxococcota bacterium]